MVLLTRCSLGRCTEVVSTGRRMQRERRWKLQPRRGGERVHFAFGYGWGGVRSGDWR